MLGKMRPNAWTHANIACLQFGKCDCEIELSLLARGNYRNSGNCGKIASGLPFIVFSWFVRSVNPFEYSYSNSRLQTRFIPAGSSAWRRWSSASRPRFPRSRLLRGLGVVSGKRKELPRGHSSRRNKGPTLRAANFVVLYGCPAA